MGEVVNVLVAVAVVVLVVRWATSGGKDSSGAPSPSTVLGFRPKNVTPEMVEAVHGMFPDIPSDNIRYDLLRTGSAQLTSNKILERGFLPAPPPAYYTLYPRAAEPAAPGRPATATNNANAAAASSKSKKNENLLTRYHLEGRTSGTSIGEAPEDLGGKAVWEESAEKREASLRERKARMILAARERLLAQQAKEKEAGAA
ncbi:Coupling of ubiquitin conjugation to ER degradation protein 1 [Trametes pubescens]|uniref:Coupling of ubiquitin conjugation to ER degradation protein 1 n=1 Tax=Trametes pubescens TaxID=154538 RepID=A0A1M2V6D5_TRAPU|nr:Coupling of ubiquitin conjugation to ER degradation protein 1 [Trametes pubescens]